MKTVNNTTRSSAKLHGNVPGQHYFFQQLLIHLVSEEVCLIAVMISMVFLF